MRKILFTGLILILMAGCASHKVIIPSMDLPTAPAKPKIITQVIQWENKPYVCYSLSDSLRLYEFLLSKDAYEEKLIFRINQMNEVVRGMK